MADVMSILAERAAEAARAASALEPSSTSTAQSSSDSRASVPDESASASEEDDNNCDVVPIEDTDGRYGDGYKDIANLIINVICSDLHTLDGIDCYNLNSGNFIGRIMFTILNGLDISNPDNKEMIQKVIDEYPRSNKSTEEQKVVTDGEPRPIHPGSKSAKVAQEPITNTVLEDELARIDEEEQPVVEGEQPVLSGGGLFNNDPCLKVAKQTIKESSDKSSY
jgi:hypothetical protein